MVAVALLIPAIASAQVSIDGTWKIDVRVVRLTSPDGQTLNFVNDDKERGTRMTFAAKKQ
jgi:hypothetical protein